MKRPQIIVYGPTTDAPTGMQFAAAMVPNGKPGSYWMSTGPTPDAARTKLEEMWDKAYPPERKGPPRAAKVAQVEALDDLV